eukprot:scaffold227296_cov32-Tisochrysis_lutea.AAC.2
MAARLSPPSSFSSGWQRRNSRESTCRPDAVFASRNSTGHVAWTPAAQRSAAPAADEASWLTTCQYRTPSNGE